MKDRQTQLKSNEIEPRPQKLGLDLTEVIEDPSINNPGMESLRAKLEHDHGTHLGLEREKIIDSISHLLLQQSLEVSKREASQRLIPYKDNGEPRKRMILGSAATASNAWNTEVGHYGENGEIIGMSEAIETRDITGAKEGDIVVSQTETGARITTQKEGLTEIDLYSEIIIETNDGKVIRGGDMYYKTDALLLLMICNPNSEVLSQIKVSINQVNPVMEPYNMDPEMQIVLLRLANEVGADRLDVRSNSPEVANVLTEKSSRYPKAVDAARLKYIDDADEMQKAEWELSLYGELGLHPDEIPGYWVETDNELEENLWLTLALHSTRYDFEDVYRKPSKGTDGGGQGAIHIGKIPDDVKAEITDLLDAGNRVAAVNKFKENLPSESDAQEQIDLMIEASESDDGISWVIEANVDILGFTLDIDQSGELIQFYLQTLPSAQIQNGKVRDEISAQLNNGKKEWGGNSILSEEAWKSIINRIYEIAERTETEQSSIDKHKEEQDFLIDAHAELTEKLRRFNEAVNSSERFEDGLVRGSYDSIIGRLGGKFKGRLVVGMGDPNLRANGSESAYNLYDESKDKYGDQGGAVTRNFVPNHDFETTEVAINNAVKKLKEAHNVVIDPEDIKLIGISEGWGQIGLKGSNGLGLITKILILEQVLRNSGAIK